MLPRIFLVPGLLLMLSYSAFAQDDANEDAAPTAAATSSDSEAGDDAADDETVDSEAASARPSDKPAPPPGDVVKLVTGKELAGVQVLRASPAVVEVRIVEGLDSMKIPRNQVLDIVYDDVDPNNPSSKVSAGAPNASSSVVPAERLAPELNEKLGAPIPGTPKEYADRNFVQVMGEIAEAVGIELEFKPEVKALPVEKKKWSLKLEAGSTLRAILEKDLPTAFPDLVINYDQFNKIVIGLKAA